VRNAVNRVQQQLKRRARDLVRKALNAGELQRQPCEVCLDLKVEAHHDDYSRPLDVRWFCVRHHALFRTTRCEIMNRAIQINGLHQGVCEGMLTTLQTAIQIGELLVAQKKECPHGGWIPWIEANLSFSQATAGLALYISRRHNRKSPKPARERSQSPPLSRSSSFRERNRSTIFPIISRHRRSYLTDFEKRFKMLFLEH
jgi:Protein of unknown function (DUF3102)